MSASKPLPQVREGSRPDRLRSCPTVVVFSHPQPGMVKIGEASRQLGISVQAIRLYEQEGLIISFKSQKGTRWYSQEDLIWMRRIRELIGEGLNFAGIRHLLAQVPCWELKPCSPEDRQGCCMRFESQVPCWAAPEKLCSEKLKECYFCNTYRSAPKFVNLKQNARIIPLQS